MSYTTDVLMWCNKSFVHEHVLHFSQVEGNINEVRYRFIGKNELNVDKLLKPLHKISMLHGVTIIKNLYINYGV